MRFTLTVVLLATFGGTALAKRQLFPDQTGGARCGCYRRMSFQLL